MTARIDLLGRVERNANAGPRRRWLISLAALIVYFPLFLLAHSLLGNVALAIVFLPALLWAALLGRWPALVGSILLTIPNFFILHSLEAMQTPAEDLQLLASHLVIGLVSFLVGYSYFLRRNLSGELAERQISDARFRGLFERTNDAVFIFSPGLMILDVNEQAARMLGYEPGELVGKDYHQFVLAEETSDVDSRLQQAISGLPMPLYERTLLKKDGSPISVEVSAAAMLDAQGRPVHIQSICRDITERKAAEERLFHQATHDELTGLFNRAMFFSLLDQMIKLDHRQDQRLAVLFLDLDGFKEVNDTYGHTVGDLLLRQCAARMREQLRRSDIIARMGGDEFAVILPTLSDEKYAGQVAQAIEETLKSPFDLDGKAVSISASIGFSLFPRDGRDADTLVNLADQAMYAVKEKKKRARGGTRME